MVCAKVKKVTIKGVDCALYEVAGHKAFRGIPTLFMSPKSIAIISKCAKHISQLRGRANNDKL